MKKTVLLIALFTGIFIQRAFSQANSTPDPLAQLLTRYYSVKDALIAGNSTATSTNAMQLVKVLNSIDYKVISEGNINALLKDATLISEMGDLEQQRTRFANLSDNMIAVAKAVRLSPGPLYQVYCPMKKASWLNHDKTIRNPYYGSAMLGCGEVVETIHQ